MPELGAPRCQTGQEMAKTEASLKEHFHKLRGEAMTDLCVVSTLSSIVKASWRNEEGSGRAVEERNYRHPYRQGPRDVADLMEAPSMARKRAKIPRTP